MSEIKTPRAFISYSWDSDEHRDWVRNLATRMRQDGVDLLLDQWGLAPGDQLPEFMEHSVRDHDFVLIICTPRYKQKSDQRVGGVGYEGHITDGRAYDSTQRPEVYPYSPARQFGKTPRPHG